MQFNFDLFDDVLWIDKVDDGREEGTEDGHDQLFFDDTVFRVVVEDDGLDHEGHQSSCEEHA